MIDELTEGWAKVEDALSGAKAIAWDGCHKIYVLLDDEQVAESRGYGYDQAPSQLVMVTDTGDALATLHEWYDASCMLKLIDSVRTVTGDPNLGFTKLIAQFAEDDDAEDDFDEDLADDGNYEEEADE